MSDEDLRRELDYYKRQLDELAGQRISFEHHEWALHTQLRQRTQGLQLLSKLALSFGAHTDLASIFRVSVLAINASLQMDRSAIFVPDAQSGAYEPAYFAGVSEAHAQRLTTTAFAFSAQLIASSGWLLVDDSAEETPLSTQLRHEFGVETFICVPVMDGRQLLGIIFSGRVGGHSSRFRPLDSGDVDTFRAIAGIIQAVTQHTRLALLEQTERLKTEFFSDVAHEFRTPLTLTLGPLSQILAGKWGSVPEAVSERLRVVERNQERLLLLINQIMDLSRLEASAAELRAERIPDLNLLVRDCVAHFRSAAEARGLNLKLSLDPALSVMPVLADREKLERALVNLLSNALKFTDHGQIEVSACEREGWLELVVTDTGIGIADEDLPHVFDRFRRSVALDRRRSAGSGIGLALVKRIAELHRGQVIAESHGTGSRFTLRLPLVRASETLPEAERHEELRHISAPFLVARDSSPKAAGAGVDALNRQVEARFQPDRPIVLYVEDDADLREHVKNSLAENFNVFLAVDGVDGLEKARRYWPDAIISDQLMPRMSGVQFLAALREDPELRSIPVVFVTAQYGTEGRIESLDAGADDYLTKPFHDAELRSRVMNLIRAHRQQRELEQLNRRLRLQVGEQMAELARAGELERFLPRALVDSLLAAGERPRPQRRQATVLVTELTALAAFGERADEPAIAALINGYIGAVTTICAARGGVIDGFGAGRLSALFGTGQDDVAADAAWAAVRASFEIRQTMQQASADARRRGLAVEQPRGIAIASGACTFGTFGGDSLRAYTAMGRLTASAASLQSLVATGKIACDSATLSLLGSRVGARALENQGHEITSLTDDAEPALAAAPPAEWADPAPHERLFRREGEYWTVAYDERVFRLKSSKGTLYLAHLLARPHHEIHVMELARVSERDESGPRGMSAREAAELGLRATAGDAAVPLLDERAKLAYRARLLQLETQFEAAQSFGDTERARQVDAEKAELTRQLASAMGLGGRGRAASTPAERQRVNVTRTVSAVLRKIRRENAQLGRHLAASIHTGTFCSYAPEPGAPKGWLVSF